MTTDLQKMIVHTYKQRRSINAVSRELGTCSGYTSRVCRRIIGGEIGTDKVILERLRNGDSVDVISISMNVCVDRVKAIFRAQPISEKTIKSKKTKGLKEKLIVETVKEHNRKGLSISNVDLAAMLKTGVSYVSEVRRRHGIQKGSGLSAAQKAVICHEMGMAKREIMEALDITANIYDSAMRYHRDRDQINKKRREQREESRRQESLSGKWLSMPLRSV